MHLESPIVEHNFSWVCILTWGQAYQHNSHTHNPSDIQCYMSHIYGLLIMFLLRCTFALYRIFLSIIYSWACKHNIWKTAFLYMEKVFLAQRLNKSWSNFSAECTETWKLKSIFSFQSVRDSKASIFPKMSQYSFKNQYGLYGAYTPHKS